MAAGDLVSRIYSGFRGVDFRGEEVNLSRSPDALNVWRDYTKTDGIQTRPGLMLHTEATATVYGIYFYKGKAIAHVGDRLCVLTDGGMEEIISGAKEGHSDGFVYEDVFYFKDGEHYWQYNGETIADVEPYVPTTSISRAPSGSNSAHQDVNMLTGLRINTFVADGTSFDYYLDAYDIDQDFVPEVTVNGVKLEDGFTVDYAKGCVSFTEAPAAPLTGGQDNVSILFSKTVNGQKEAVLGCTLLQVFDNRVFFSGNDAFPNVVMHCSLNEPGYVSDLDYYREGMDSAKVKGMVAGNNALWVFREPSDANTTVFYHTPTIDDVYGKIYPSSHSSVTTGCIGKAINFNDDIVFFSERGMEGISGDITTEQVLGHRSTLVDRRMTAEPGYADMILAEWNGYLLVFIGSKVYLADSRGRFQNENHMEYDWFYWELPEKVSCAKVYGGVLYVGTKTGIYTMTDDRCFMESYWVTPKDKFKYPNLQKTTNKRGCVVEGTGDIAVYAKTEAEEFRHVVTQTEVMDSFAPRVKRKKFKDLQLKFHSVTRFTLDSVTIEAFLGGYLKR